MSERQIAQGVTEHEVETATVPKCRNCDTVAPDAYCPHCGQRMQVEPPTFLEFVREFILHNMHVEGRLGKTLKVLLFRPGGLTLDYFAGRRQRYVAPLSLFLTVAFAYVLLSGISSGRVRTELPSQGVSQARPKPMSCAPGETACEFLRSRLAAAQKRIDADREGFYSRDSERLGKSLSFGALAMLPIFAGIVALVYRKRRRTYGEHIVFGLHLHSFGFLASIPMVWVSSAYAWPLWLGMNVYAVVALHRVYGGRKWATAVRAVAIGFIYYFLLLVVTLAFSLYLLFT